MHIELVVAQIITMLLGFLVANQAYRGYRLHGSKPMVYVAVEFLIISVSAVIEGILFEVVGLEIFIAGLSRRPLSLLEWSWVCTRYTAI